MTADAKPIDRILTMEVVRVTERAAIAAARLRGRGDEMAADQAAVDAMRTELNRLPIKGTIVIGEGERDEAPMLYIGEEVGLSDQPKVDIALDPLEGTTICAKNLPNSLAVIAVAEDGTNAPDVYMEKIAVGPGYPEEIIDLDTPIEETISILAKEKGVPAAEVTACVLDRPRHTKIIEDIRKTGAAIRLIGDGDIAGVIHTTNPDDTGIDMYWPPLPCAVLVGRFKGGWSSATTRNADGQSASALAISTGNITGTKWLRVMSSSPQPA